MPEAFQTERLLLRRWLPADRVPFAAMNANAQVMKFFPAVLTQEESDALVERIEAHFAQYGFGLWAVEIPGVTSFAGFIGLLIPRFEAHFTPCVEIGWRLAEEYWGRGYATEGARASLKFGFEILKLEQIVSFTVPNNLRSRRVMEKIGMTHNLEDNFLHPSLSKEDPLQEHVLYRIKANNTRQMG